MEKMYASNIMRAYSSIKKQMGKCMYKYPKDIVYDSERPFYAVKAKIVDGVFANSRMDVYEGIVVNTGNVKKCYFSFGGINDYEIDVYKYNCPIMLPFPVSRLGSFYTYITVKFFDAFDEEIPASKVDAEIVGVASFREFKGRRDGDFEYGPYKVRYRDDILCFIKTYSPHFSFDKFYDYVDYHFENSRK